MSKWTVYALAVVIAFFGFVAGHWSASLWLALAVFLVVGSIFPPVGIIVGAIVVLRLVLVHGPTVIQNVQKQLQPSAAA